MRRETEVQRAPQHAREVEGATPSGVRTVPACAAGLTPTLRVPAAWALVGALGCVTTGPPDAKSDEPADETETETETETEVPETDLDSDDTTEDTGERYVTDVACRASTTPISMTTLPVLHRLQFRQEFFRGVWDWNGDGNPGIVLSDAHHWVIPDVVELQRKVFDPPRPWASTHDPASGLGQTHRPGELLDYVYGNHISVHGPTNLPSLYTTWIYNNLNRGNVTQELGLSVWMPGRTGVVVPNEGDFTFWLRANEYAEGVVLADLNGDRIDDLGVFFPIGDHRGELDPHLGGTQGTARIRFGPFDAASYDLTDVDAIIDGPADHTFFANAGAAGDLDGDGIGDLAVAAPTDGGGAVYVFRGPILGHLHAATDAWATFRAAPPAGDAPGFARQIEVGDVTGDGQDDLVIAAPDATTTAGVEKGGQVLVFKGPLLPGAHTSATAWTRLEGEREAHHLGLMLGALQLDDDPALEIWAGGRAPIPNDPKDDWYFACETALTDSDRVADWGHTGDERCLQAVMASLNFFDALAPGTRLDRDAMLRIEGKWARQGSTYVDASPWAFPLGDPDGDGLIDVGITGFGKNVLHTIEPCDAP